MMVYKMEVFSPSLELQGILETFSSLLVTEQAFKAGEFTLDCPMTDATKSLLVPDNIIWFYDTVAGIIESISASTNEAGISVTLRGPLLSGLLSRRILWGLYNVSGSPSKIMCDMVADCAVSPTRGDTAARIIPGLAIGERPTDTRSIRKQSTGENLLDFLIDVGQTNLTAFGVDFNPATPSMVFWARPGVNRTINQTDVDPVYYGTELDDVLSSAYDYDSSEYGNLALVAGEGEGTSRIYKTVSSTYTYSSGMSRYEIYIDARDLQKDADTENPMTDEEYQTALQDRGLEKLADTQLIQSFEATIRTQNPTYEYGKDFFIGDTITIKDDRLGISVSAVVESVERSISSNGEDLVFMFGYGAPTITEKIKRGLK